MPEPKEKKKICKVEVSIFFLSAHIVLMYKFIIVFLKKSSNSARINLHDLKFKKHYFFSYYTLL